MIALDSIERDAWPESLKPFARAINLKIETSFAGATLARLRRDASIRRRQRVYTGVISGRRAWRHMKVVLADAYIGEVLMARRGAAMVMWRDEFAVKPDKIGACATNELRPFKLPAAVLLGALKKGVKEKPSQRKACAARNNGCKPPRPGSRPRGRPRTSRIPELECATESSLRKVS